MPSYIGAIDQGTTSSRFILFDRDGRIVQGHQREHEQITPRAGWVEHDPKEVWRRTREVIGGALASSDCEAGDIAAIGITNQRETTVVWDRENGELAFGTMDTWVLWNLTGGTDGGIHVTDATNASRTLLMDLASLDWHEPSLELMGVPRAMLPEIRSSSEQYGEAAGTAVGGRPL